MIVWRHTVKIVLFKEGTVFLHAKTRRLNGFAQTSKEGHPNTLSVLFKRLSPNWFVTKTSGAVMLSGY